MSKRKCYPLSIQTQPKCLHFIPPLTPSSLLGTTFGLFDGPIIRFYGMPFTTRMVVIKLPNDQLWIHSPINLTDDLQESLSTLGQVSSLISPNKIHYWYISDFQKTYPQAQTFASDGVQKRAQKTGKSIRWDAELKELSPDHFHDIEIIPLRGNRFMTEYTFFHFPSKTWIVTDIIENFEPSKINFPFRILASLGGCLHPYGGTTRDQRLLYYGNHHLLNQAINRVKELTPSRIIMAHGKILEKNIPQEMDRIFGWVKG